MLGIACKWVCPSCENLIKTNSPFWTKELRKTLEEPKRCPCGRKRDFRLVGIEQCEFVAQSEKSKKDNKEES
jgi:hypothetical protein